MADNAYEIVGKIARIMDQQTFGSGFTKREFLLATEEEHSQMVKFECIKNLCALLDKVAVDDRVRVSFRLRGSEYKERFFVNLYATQIEKMGVDGASVSVEETAPPPDDEPMPF